MPALRKLFSIRRNISDKPNLIVQFLLNFQLQKFRDELKNRSRVLKKLGHIDADGVVQLKGRAASLIDTGDELLVTELMFNGIGATCY